MDLKTERKKIIRQGKDLTIRPQFPFYDRAGSLKSHIENIRQKIIAFLPKPLPFKEREGFAKWLEQEVPLITWDSIETCPACLTLTFLTRPIDSLPTETFLSEMVKRWLLPHQETTILSFEHLTFRFDLYPKLTYFFGQAKILIEHWRQIAELKDNLPFLKKEIRIALHSGRHAKLLLESKALPADQKLNLIRENFIRLMNKFPHELDESLFDSLAYLQAYTSEEFRKERSFDHLGRVLFTFVNAESYLIRKVNAFPEKRHMKTRLLPTELSFPFGKKPVTGLTIALNLFHEYEFFEEKHVLRAIQKFLPSVRIVPGSTFRFPLNHDSIVRLYLEMEKEDGSSITLDERKFLSGHLEEELKKRIEHRVPSLFFVRNEEEIMRNILILSREIKSKDDHPQMMVSYDQHSQEDLVFTVVLLRVKKEDSPSLQELLKDKDPEIQYLPDRIQVVSYFEQVTPIEANVFRIQMTKLPVFLRMDFSVNLYLAREKVVAFLKENLGEIRDYNGGMIVKQGELLTQFKRIFQDVSVRNQEILENFFYSLNPIEAQATIPLQQLSLIFQLFIKTTEEELNREQDYILDFVQDEEVTVGIIRGRDLSFDPLVREALSNSKIKDRSLISSTMNIDGSHIFSFLYKDDEKTNHELIREILYKTMKKWCDTRRKIQTLNLPFADFVSLDPRVGGDQESSVVIKLLFDGLMRVNREGKPELAVAESYEISEDQKTYTFKLKKTFWSNGDPVTAHDFEYAWKKILSPNFKTPFAYIFYPIKNGKEAKEGKKSLDQVGIRSLNDETLQIELEYPSPYFIELTSNILYSPVNHLVDQKHPNWSKQKGSHFVCNGPYCQVEPRQGFAYELVKNEHYTLKDQVKIDKINLTNVKGKRLIEMLERQELDCVACNLCPVHISSIRGGWGDFSYFHSQKVMWFCFNHAQPPFNSLLIRKAFSQAISRIEILDRHPEKRYPSFTPLPFQLSLCKEDDCIILEDREKAKESFKRGLEEMGIKKEDFPIIYISCNLSEKPTAALIKQQWEQVFGIKCVLEPAEWKKHFEKLIKRSHHIGLVYWTSWFNDPIYTLQAFKEAKEKVNFSAWENEEYKQLLDQANLELDLDKRKELFYQAEKILTREAVVLPFCYGLDWYIKNPRLKVSKSITNGSLDFSHAYFA